MSEYHDLMLPISRALPADGMEVVARVNGEQIVRTIFDKGFPMPDVISWVWLPRARCSCHKLRWGGSHVGTCKKCGTRWLGEKRKKSPPQLPEYPFALPKI